MEVDRAIWWCSDHLLQNVFEDALTVEEQRWQVVSVRLDGIAKLFLQDYYKWALERGETQGGQKDMNYACVAVADLQFPAAYLNQMDHQHKVCREGWFVFRVPPGI